MITYKDILTIIVALAAPIVTYFIYSMHKKSMQNLSIFNINEKYRSLEMYIAIKTLWDFYRKCKEKENELCERYLEMIKKDEDKISKIKDIGGKLKYESQTIDYYRRMVTQFYDYLSFLIDNNIVPKSCIYELWTEHDLEIIPKIIIPMEYMKTLYIGRVFEDKHHFICKSPSIKKKLKLYEYSKSHSN